MSASKAKHVNTDAALTRQLDAAQGTDQLIEAVLVLQPSNKRNQAPTDVRHIADAVIERVQQEVGIAPTAVNVLTNLGMVVIAAHETFVRKLLDQPEFASAVANSNVTANRSKKIPSDNEPGTTPTRPRKRRKRTKKLAESEVTTE